MAYPESEYQMIQELSGADENGNSKCIISIQPQRCDAEGNTTNTDEEYVTEKPIVKMFKQAGGYVLVDLVFSSMQDVDLRRTYSYLADFFTATNSTTDDELDFPLLVISFVPNSLQGEYFALGINPIFYALTPDDVTGEPNTIRMVFIYQDDPDEVPNFLFLRSDADELDKILEDDELEEESPRY